MSDRSDRITVLLVDDHAVVREGYRRLLERSGNIAVVGEAADANAALALLRDLRPQIIIMDITLPGMSGIDALRRMVSLEPQVRVLMFSMHEEAIFARRALQAGAFGYVTKASAPTVLVEAVQAVAADKKYLSPALAQDLALRHVADDEAGHGLTAREFEILRRLAQGESIKDMARSLGLSPKTVANHQSAIKHKLGAATPIQLLRKAESLGLHRDS